MKTQVNFLFRVGSTAGGLIEATFFQLTNGAIVLNVSVCSFRLGGCTIGGRGVSVLLLLLLLLLLLFANKIDKHNTIIVVVSVLMWTL